jgi:hypothetical protein
MFLFFPVQKTLHDVDIAVKRDIIEVFGSGRAIPAVIATWQGI